MIISLKIPIQRPDKNTVIRRLSEHFFPFFDDGQVSRRCSYGEYREHCRVWMYQRLQRPSFSGFSCHLERSRPLHRSLLFIRGSRMLFHKSFQFFDDNQTLLRFGHIFQPPWESFFGFWCSPGGNGYHSKAV